MLSLMSFLSSLPPAPIDPIFLVAEEARKAGEGVINASIGMMLDEEGKTVLLPSVRAVVQRWASRTESDGFPYPPLLGVPAFRAAVSSMVFGPGVPVASIAATGGTGALAFNLRLLRLLGYGSALLPEPSWPNHRRMLLAQQFQLRTVPYLQEGAASVQPFLEAIGGLTEPTVLLLQASGHNPTGLSWTAAEWRALAVGLSGSRHAVLLDCAYQGLGRGVDEDVEAVRILQSQHVSLLVAWSASKNHSLYGLRTGLACVVAGTDAERVEVERHYQIIAREMHSAASTMGQLLVADVQLARGAQWRTELASIREGLLMRRTELSKAFPAWHKVLDGQGLFAVLPLSSQAVLNLRAQKVFLTEDGRVNLAGIPLGRLGTFVDAVRAVA